jgi:FG-GAP repeat protein/VCBS repeat protein
MPRLRVAFSAVTLLVAFAALAQTSTAATVPNLVPRTSPVWIAEGSHAAWADDDFGYTLAAAGDINGDGHGDVIIAAPGWNSSRGRVQLFLGSAAGLSASPSWTLDGAQDLGILGNSVAGGGDINRDGYADIIVGEPGYHGTLEEQGRALVFVGSRHGLRLFGEIVGEEAGKALGSSVAFAGDVNGDGYDDILVGSLWLDGARTTLYMGRPGRLERSPAWTLQGTYSCEGIGDVNGDGYDDVGTPGAGAFYGSRAGLPSTPSWTGPQATVFSGRGDVNGDGYGDLVLGGYVTNTVRLFLGSANGLAGIPAWQTSDGTSDFGTSVSIAGDVNGDGLSDIAVSSPRHQEDGTLAPSVLVYLGDRVLLSMNPNWRGTDGSPGFIRKVALGADVDCDGSSEVLFADPDGFVAPGIPSGRTYLYRVGPAFPAPQIRHEPAAVAIPAGSSLTIEADIEDQTHFVAQAFIRYRFVEEFEFETSVMMERIGDTRYRGVIPAPTGFRSGFVYSIRGVDDYGVVGETALTGVDYVSAAGTVRFQARLTSDPLHGFQILFTTSRLGPAKTQVFDVSGRHVATLLDVSSLEPGSHRVDVGRKMGRSGVYFYRVETSEGVQTGRFVQVR